MKAVVDADACEGCETCVELCPEVYSMEGDVAVAIEGDIPADQLEDAQEGADSCPVEAIVIS